jgi:hypothetical protein
MNTRAPRRVGRGTMTTRIALATFLVALVASGHAPVEAGGAKAVVNGGAPVTQRVFVAPGAQVVVNAPSRVVVAPSSRVVVNAPSQIIVATSSVWAFPVYVAQPRRCLVPGSWEYAWVPQSYAYNVWIDSEYTVEGVWVEGHWEPRVYTTGYYQPYWSPERWGDC